MKKNNELLEKINKKDIKLKEEIARKYGINIFKIITNLALGNNTFLYGEAGSGKTEMAKEIANFLELEYEILNCSQWTSPIDIIGGYTINGYTEGKLIRAFREGKIIILDELPKLEPNTAGLLNEILSYRVYQYEDVKSMPYITDGLGKKIQMNPNFRVIATGNTNMKTTSSKYSANYVQDLSLVDRFNGSFYKIEFNEKLASYLMNPFMGLFNVLNVIRKAINDLEMNENISLRIMLDFKEVAKYQTEYDKEQRRTLLRVKDKFDNFFENMNEDDYSILINHLKQRGIADKLSLFINSKTSDVLYNFDIQY